MTPTTVTATECSSAPRLRLLPKKEHTAAVCDQPTAPAVECRPGLRPVRDARRDDRSPVLVAGRDPAERADVLESLTKIMTRRTPFEQAGTFWEVLVRAPASRMVILSGELDGMPAESLLRMLGHRHPGLPVVSLDASALANL
jgi:hypothetical protein